MDQELHRVDHPIKDGVREYSNYYLMGAEQEFHYEDENGKPVGESITVFVPFRKYLKNTSKYMPHQGYKERFKRLGYMGKLNALYRMGVSVEDIPFNEIEMRRLAEALEGPENLYKAFE